MVSLSFKITFLKNIAESYQYKYNGKEYQDELGLNLYAYGYRHYDPAIARWTTMDPLLNDLDFTFDENDIDEEDEDEIYMSFVTKLENGDGIFNTDNLNPYGYGYNNPISFDDPDGRCPICIIAAMLLYSEFANAPTGDVVTDSRNYNASKENRTIVSETILKRGGNANPLKSNKIKSASENSNKKAETLAKNQEKGKKFEDKVGKDLEKSGNKNIQDQVTIKPNGGGTGNVRVDKVSTKKGKTVLTEAKSSKTAPLTKNQKAGFPVIKKNGGTVVGKGKPGYPGGTQIPPTKVNVVRPVEPK